MPSCARPQIGAHLRLPGCRLSALLNKSIRCQENKMKAQRSRNFLALVVVLLASLASRQSWAHCDSLEGPVVQDARAALDKGDPTPVLKWIGKEHEAAISEAFKQTMTVREKGSDARLLADRYFFETLVRLHRAGEGEAFTGLKPARAVDPGITAADKALQTGSAKELASHMSAAVAQGIQKRFAAAMERKKHAADSVAGGRQYVASYVDYIHFVENVNRLASHGAPRLHHEAGAQAH
jgi:hypothetical protein